MSLAALRKTDFSLCVGLFPWITCFCHMYRSRLTLHESLFTLHESLFTLHESLFTLHESLFTAIEGHPCSTSRWDRMTATYCNTLQQTATHCNTLQQTAICGVAAPSRVLRSSGRVWQGPCPYLLWIVSGCGTRYTGIKQPMHFYHHIFLKCIFTTKYFWK